jgi:hypothetical protein
MTWSFPSSAKQVFVDGWTKYVKPGGWSPQPPPSDYYWNPRASNWYLYPIGTHTVEDKGWPQTDLSGLLVQAATVFDRIMQQYHDLPDPSEPYAMWDPRTGKWMSVTQKGGAGDKSAALAKLLADVAELHKKGYLSVHATAEIQTLVQHEI